MRLYINDKSTHPGQQQLEEQNSPLKIVGRGIFLAASSVVLFAISFYTVPDNLLALMKLANGGEVVNISFPSFFLIWGFFLWPFILLVSYSLIVHRRAVVPEELTPPFRKIGTFLNKTAKACLYIATPICFALAFLFIQWHDYHWCPQEETTIWDSQWAIDPLLCQ